MIALLLAQAYLMSPMQDGGYLATPLHNSVPLQQVPYASRLLQNAAIGDPSIRSQYEFPSDQNGYPLQTTRYGQPATPIQEQIVNQEIQTQLQQQQLQNSSMQLNLALNQKKDQYQTSVNQQALEATQQLGQFDPHSPDFEAKFTEFQKANPLAFQNQGFRQLASNLVATRAQFVHDETMTNRATQSLQDHAAATEAAYQGRLLNEHRSKAAEYGLSKDYDDALASTVSPAAPHGDPIAAYSAIAPKIAQTKEDALTRKNDNKPMSFENYSAMLIRQRNLTDNGKTDYEDLPPEKQASYDFLENQIKAFENKQGGGDSSGKVDQNSDSSKSSKSSSNSTASSQYKQGQTAVNKKTGERLIFKDGGWRPVGK